MAVTRISFAVLISPLQDLAIRSSAGSSNLRDKVGGGLDITVATGDAKSSGSFNDAPHDISHKLIVHLGGHIHGLLLTSDSGVAGHDVCILRRERGTSDAVALPSECIALKKVGDVKEIGVGCTLEKIQVAAKTILLKHMLHQPRRPHWPHGARSIVICRCWVSPDIQVVMEDSAVAAIEILSHLLTTGLSDFHEIKEWQLRLNKIGLASRPEIHLQINVNSELSAPRCTRLIIPDTLQIRRHINSGRRIARRSNKQMTAIVPYKDCKLRIIETAASILDALVCRKAGDAVGRCAEVDVGAAQESAGVGDGSVVDFLEALRYCCAEFAVDLSGEIAG